MEIKQTLVAISLLTSLRNIFYPLTLQQFNLAVVPPPIQGEAFCLPHHKEEAEHSLRSILGGGTAFQEAAADKKLQGNDCLNSSSFSGTSEGPRVKMRKIGMVVLKW